VSQKQVGKKMKRKHTIRSKQYSNANRNNAMAQAATLDAAQLQRVLDYLKTRRHYQRNRVMLLLTHWSMLRVGEVAALRYCDVLEADGQIRSEAVLAAEQTKGDKSRRIWFNERMRAELAAYVAAHRPKYKTQKLFYTQRRDGFTANTLTHIINGIYSQAGIANASSHSGRRSGLTTLADKGVSVRVLMALAGHSQIATTQRYIDLRPSVVRAAVELV
jgi:integrase/recombinase XerD